MIMVHSKSNHLSHICYLVYVKTRLKNSLMGDNISLSLVNDAQLVCSKTRNSPK